MELFKWFTDWYGRYQVVQSIAAIFQAAFLPFVLAVMTAVAGIVGKAPIMWVVMATTLTLMGAVVAIFFISLLSDFRTPCNKLRYVNTVLNVDFCEAPNRKTKRANQSVTQSGPPQSYLNKAQVGIQLHNTASFPISAFMEFAVTKIEGKDPPRSTFPKLAVTIAPGSIVNITDDGIELPVTPCGKLNGLMDIKIKYGKKGKEKFELVFKAKLEIFMRRDGLVSQILTAWDTNQIVAISPPA